MFVCRDLLFLLRAEFPPPVLGLKGRDIATKRKHRDSVNFRNPPTPRSPHQEAPRHPMGHTKPAGKRVNIRRHGVCSGLEFGRF